MGAPGGMGTGGRVDRASNRRQNAMASGFGLRHALLRRHGCGLWCLACAAICFERWLGSLTLVGRLLFSFALACVIGLFWEFAELASDVFRGTHIQHSVRETMRDLIADACGAVVTLSLVSWTGRK
jgi:hypothetical protein